MMEVITTSNTTNTNTNSTPITTTTNSKSKSPEPESETPTRIQQQQPTNTITKPLSFSNGVLKRHHHHTNHHNHHHHHQHNNTTAIIHPQAVTVTVTYKECLKNHVASIGGHALDGCCEFMPSPTATADDPSSIKCAACGCHRNFHRREPEEPISAVFDFQPHHRHHPPPPPHRSPSSTSPPPISSYPSAPHILLALSGAGVGLSVPPENTAAPTNLSPAGTSRKRFRTKFTQEQKEKMHEFAEKVGWKMQKRDEEMVNGFCNEVGVDRGVLKVWMHNNKNTLGRKLEHVNANGTVSGSVGGGGGGGGGGDSGVRAVNNENDSGTNVATTNGSSSSS